MPLIAFNRQSEFCNSALVCYLIATCCFFYNKSSKIIRLLPCEPNRIPSGVMRALCIVIKTSHNNPHFKNTIKPFHGMQSTLIVLLLRFGTTPISTRHDNFSKLCQIKILFHIISSKITRCNKRGFLSTEHLIHILLIKHTCCK